MGRPQSAPRATLPTPAGEPRRAATESAPSPCEGRGGEVQPDSLRDAEVERRSREEYPQLVAEIVRPLPEFDEVYGKVRGYYESWPWEG